MRNIVLTFILILISKEYFACSCNGNPSFYFHYNSADKIFKGRVLSIKKLDDNRSINILFQVITKYKGEIIADTITINTGLGHGDCGLPVDTNDVWIIFEEKSYTNICSSNFLLEREGKEKNIHPWGIYDFKTFLKPLEEISTIEKKYIKEYDSKEHLVADGQISNGVAQGYWVYYFEPNENWPTKQKVYYKNGLKDSIEYEYYKNGKIYREQMWKNGKKNGREIYYYPDSSIDVSRYYVNDEKDGTWEDFYENGKSQSREYYKMGKSIMSCTHFYENGDTSWVHYYDNSGKIIKGMMKYKSGKTQSTDVYHYIDSLHIRDATYYYENGNIKFKYSNYRDKKSGYKYHGEHFEFYENGNIKEKKYYEYGKEIGTWYYYDENGKIEKTENK